MRRHMRISCDSALSTATMWRAGSILLVVIACATSLAPESPISVDRRSLLRQTVAVATAAATPVLAIMAPPALAATAGKSRTEGYAVQHTEREWAYMLSGLQYNVLRQGGTERQKSSILYPYTERDVGTYRCAACDTPLFASDDKFASGTGWPSFSSALEGVEEEVVDPIRATLGGREVRCHTCGGHLGDLFNDGWTYLGSSAARTGKRYCIDGAALVFVPAAEGVDEIYGDTPPPNKVILYEPSLYR